MTPTNAELVARARALAREFQTPLPRTLTEARWLLPLLADRLEAAEGAGGVEGT